MCVWKCGTPPTPAIALKTATQSGHLSIYRRLAGAAGVPTPGTG